MYLDPRLSVAFRVHLGDFMPNDLVIVVDNVPGQYQRIKAGLRNVVAIGLAGLIQ